MAVFGVNKKRFAPDQVVKPDPNANPCERCCLVFETSLAGEDHGSAFFIADLDDFEVPL